MATHDKKNSINTSGVPMSENDTARGHDVQITNQTGKLKYDRKSLLLLLLMLLTISQVIVLLANSGFINRTPEPTVNEQPISLDEIKAVETDLKKVIKSLNNINGESNPKEDVVKVKKIEVKPVKVSPLPVKVQKKVKVVKQEKKIVKPEQEITENKKTAPVKKALIAVEPVPVIVNDETPVQIEKSAYIKYDINGNSLEDNVAQWTCVYDKKNGLMWEVKSKDDAMRNPENLYSWFSPENKALKGITDGGRCTGDTDCDTDAYVKAMNQKNFCGHDDWRLPTREEMLGLVDYSGDSIKIDTSYFPETLPSWYWTASSNTTRPEFAWYVLFKNGMPLNDLKESPKHIRLVRKDPYLVSN